MLGIILNNVRNTSPLVHSITNYVTVNDCANILLATGASPIMSDDTDEVIEIISLCSGLVINIGTLNKQTIPAMFLAGNKARDLGKPIVLDPVGAGASRLRTETALKLIAEVQPTVIRGNMSEIKALAGAGASTKGVDADIRDAITAETQDDAIRFAKRYAEQTGAIIAITGAIDIVTDGCTSYLIHNGHSMMPKITGSGCMLSVLTGAYTAANTEQILEATAASFCAMGLAGERAYSKLEKISGGNSSYRNLLIDEIYHMTTEMLVKGAKYEIR